MKCILWAVAYIHSIGIVHRDLKPGKISLLLMKHRQYTYWRKKWFDYYQSCWLWFECKVRSCFIYYSGSTLWYLDIHGSRSCFQEGVLKECRCMVNWDNHVHAVNRRRSSLVYKLGQCDIIQGEAVKYYSVAFPFTFISVIDDHIHSV
jgi:hypothetical protein